MPRLRPQTALAAAHPDNRLLQLRGNAGTHDLTLGTATLNTLKGLTGAGAKAKVPRWAASGVWEAGALGVRVPGGWMLLCAAKAMHAGVGGCPGTQKGADGRLCLGVDRCPSLRNPMGSRFGAGGTAP